MVAGPLTSASGFCTMNLKRGELGSRGDRSRMVCAIALEHLSDELPHCAGHDGSMSKMLSKPAPDHVVAFGRRVSVSEAFEDLATRGWQAETWRPTFVDSADGDRPPPAAAGA